MDCSEAARTSKPGDSILASNFLLAPIVTSCSDSVVKKAIKGA